MSKYTQPINTPTAYPFRCIGPINVWMLCWLVLQFTSCMPVAKMIYGVHNPRYVSDEAVVKYANRLGLKDDVYRIKEYTEENRKPYRYLGNSMPDILLFNSSGHLTKFEIDCSNDLNNLVALTPHSIDSMPLEGKSLQDFISDTYVINSPTQGDKLTQDMPLYVVKFAEFAGKLNKDVPAQVERLQKREDVRYVVLNMDYSVRE